MALAGSLEIEILAKIGKVLDDLNILSGAFGKFGKQVENDLAKVQESFGRLGGAATKLLGILGVAASFAALKGMADGAIEAAAAIGHLQEKVGGTAEAWSGMVSAAKAVGADMAVVEQGAVRLSRAMAGSEVETKGSSKAFEFLGISVRDAAGNMLPTEQVMQLVAKAMNRYEDGAGKAALAQDIFGKGGAALIPTLKEMAERGDAVGKTTNEMAAQAIEYEKSVRALNASKKELIQTITFGSLPAAQAFVNALVDMKRESANAGVGIKQLKEDGTILEWANLVVVNLAQIVDAFRMAAVAAGAFGGSFMSVAADIRFGFAQIQLMNGTISLADWKKTFDDRNKAAEDGNAKWAALLDMDLNKTENYVKKSIDALAALRGRTGPEFMDARDLRLNPPKLDAGAYSSTPTVPVIDTTAAQLALLKALEALSKAHADAEFAIFKAEKDHELSELQAQYALHLSTEQQFITKEAAIRTQIATANVAKLEGEIGGEVAAITKMYATVAATVGKTDADTTKKRLEGQAKIVEAQAKLQKLLGEYGIALTAVGVIEDETATKALDAFNRQMDARTQLARSVYDYLAGLQAQADQEKFEISLIGQTRAAQAQLTAARNADLALKAQTLAIDRQITDEQNKGLGADAARIADLLAARAKLIEGTDAFKAAIAALTSQKTLSTYLKSEADNAATTMANLGTSIQESMSKAFGAIGVAAGGMFKAYADGVAKQIELDKQYRESKDAVGSDVKALAKIEYDYQSKSTQNALTQYGTMAGAAASYFDKQSTAYKVLHGIEVAMFAARFAMQMEDLAVTLGIISTKTAANIASMLPALAAGAAQMFAESGWAGFAGVAAMLAVIAALGFSGGGSSVSLPSAQEMQRTQGTGTVLGDASAKSASIENALKEIERVDTLGLTYTRQMTAYLASINNAMTGLSTSIANATGITDPSQSGVNSGTVQNGISLGDRFGFWDPAGNGVNMAMHFDPILRAVNNWLAGSVTNTITNSGLGLSGTLGQQFQSPNINNQANTVQGINSFFTVHSATSGLFQGSGGDHNEWRPLPNSVVQQVQGVLDGIVTSVESAVKALGLWTPQLHDFLMSLPLDLQLSLDGLKGSDVTNAINAFFSSIADKIASSAVPGGSTNGIFMDGSFFTTFQRAGEGAFQTLIRVATEVDVVSHTFAALGLTIGPLGMTAFKAADNIVTLMGGLDKFQSSVASYVGHFYTAAEQHTMIGNSLTSEFASMNIAMPTTLQGFRDIVSGLDLTTAHGQETFAHLMAIQGAFYDFVSAISDAQTALTKHADEFKQIFGETITLADITKLQAGGEKVSDTLTRVSNEFTATNQLLSIFGLSSQQVFGAFGLASEGARAKLIEFSGGIDSFTSKLNSFYDKYFSASEKHNIELQQVTATFNALGITMPTTRQGFRDLLQSYLAQGEAGAATAAKLLGVADAFYDVTAAAEGVVSAITPLVTLLNSANNPLHPNPSVTVGGLTPVGPLFGPPNTVPHPFISSGGLSTGGLGGGPITPYTPDPALAARAAWLEKLDLLEGRRTQNEIDHEHALIGVTDDATKAEIDRYYALLDQIDAAKKATQQTLDFGAAMDKLHGTNAYSQFFAQARANDTMTAVTAAMPWIHSLNQLMTMTIDDFGHYSAANRQLILDALNAGAALQDLTDAANKGAAAQFNPGNGEGFRWVEGSGGYGYWVAVATAESQAADAAKLLSDKLSLQAQIAELTGDTVAAAAIKQQQHQIALAALDPSLRDLQTQLWGLQDAAAATAAAVEKNKTMEGLRAQILRAQGKDDEATALERRMALGAITDPEIRALQQQLYDALDAQALKQKTDAFTKTLHDFVASLKLDQNLSPLMPGQQLAEARNQYDRLLAQGSAVDPAALTAAANTFLTLDKQFEGFGGAYSADFARVMDDLSRLADPTHTAALPPTQGDTMIVSKIDAMTDRMEAATRKAEETTARLLEKLIDETRDQTAAVTDSVDNSGDKAARAAEKSKVSTR